MSPEEEDPKIDQNKSQSNEKETQSGLLGGGADAAMILETVAGFNAKAVSIMMMQLMVSDPNLIGDVEQILNAMLLFATFVVATDHHHGAIDRAVFLALEAVGSAIAARACA